MPRRRPVHPSDRKRIDRLFDAPIGGTLRLRAGKTGRVTLLVSGRSIGVIAGDLADRINLTSGMPWTPELASRVARALEEDIAREAAARLLNARERSKGELLSRLRDRGIKPAKAERVVADLERKGEVDDARFAGLMARSIIRKKPAGASLIKAALRGRRVDRETAERAAREALVGRDALADAVALARARLRTMGSSLDDRTRARRLLGLLARRGFDEETAMAAVRSLVRYEEE